MNTRATAESACARGEREGTGDGRAVRPSGLLPRAACRVHCSRRYNCEPKRHEWAPEWPVARELAAARVADACSVPEVHVSARAAGILAGTRGHVALTPGPAGTVAPRHDASAVLVLVWEC